MRRHRTTTTAALSVAALAAGLLVASGATAPSAQAATPLSPLAVPGRGADVPFVEQEAEAASTNGAVIGPDRTYGKLPSEASGRKAVTLDAVGQYVEFTLTEPANAMSLRYSVPDSADGTGLTAPIDLLVDGTKAQDLTLTSEYGWYYGGYPYNNTPGGENPHHFYDETRTMFDETLPAGTRVAVRVADTSVASSFTIDLADFELVGAPNTAPEGAIDAVADAYADPTGKTDSTVPLQNAINDAAARGTVLWIPEGRYLVTEHIIVDNVTIQGAGPWYTELNGDGVGIYGRYVADGGPSRNVNVSDLAVLGEVKERDDNDQANAFGGAMSDSTIDNVWMQHNKVGAWMDGPMDNFTISNSRILDQTADGVNFHTGVTNSTVTNTFVRNTGDDGLAMWPENVPNVNNTFSRNTVGVTLLANNIVSYGGTDITITDNVVADTVSNGGGIHVGNRYPGVTAAQGTAVAGTFDIARNTLIRAGNSDYNWNFGVGAMWFWGLNDPIEGADINVTDTDIIDSSYSAIHFIEKAVKGVHFTDVTIDGAGTFALQIQGPGEATFENVVATDIRGPSPIYNCSDYFSIAQAGGNSGWDTDSSYCGPWPERVEGDGGGTPPVTDPTDPPTTAPPAGDINLAAGKQVDTSSSLGGDYPASNATDSDASSYWESKNDSWPQTLTVDLGAPSALDRVVMALPPSSAWESRSQTVEVSSSSDGSKFSPVAGPTGYTFDPASGNTASADIDTTDTRFLRLTFTANSAWPAAQLADLQVFGS